jgi:glycosyltransferase involved in cell wall biosynthesis
MNQNNLLEIASFSPKLFQSPSAWLGHIPFAAWVIREVKPKIFVELGTHHGHSYFSFCESLVDGGFTTKCYAVDTWCGDEQSGLYGEEIFAMVNAHNAEHYAWFSRLLRMTFDDAVASFDDQSIDLLHIDGLHTYEAVRHDFETWLLKLAPGAVVMFHDTAVRERDFGVWQLWEELQRRYPNNLEFMHSHGLGVLQLNKAPDDKRLEWLYPNSPEKQKIVNYFDALGSRQVERFELAALKGQVAALYNSRSWRITRPFRVILRQVENAKRVIEFRHLLWLGHQLKRFRRVAERATLAIQRRGGFNKTLKKAVQLYRCEGLAGIRRGLMMIATFGKINPSLGSGKYDRNDYTEWIRRYDTLSDEARTLMRSHIDAFLYKPLISVVMPVYNPNPEWLIEAIESIRRQIYSCWELCIADDASIDKRIRPILERYVEEDVRIKVVFREKNGHISAASNSALTLANGEWVALMDHDDLMTEHALFWVVDAINRDQNIRLIYSDEDKIDHSGRRFDHYFKCDWNEDLFYSHNMINHLGVYRTDLLMDIGGFREELEGSQDYDLALRYIEHINPKQIHHIPRVLYHWRAHAESAAQSRDVKPYAALAGERALNEHFRRQGTNAMAESIGYGYRVRYSLPDNLPMVSLIMPTRNELQLIRKCVESILKKTTYPNYEILIIDNGSDDPATLHYFSELQAEARIRIVRDDRPFNYSALNNAAAKLAQGEIVGLLNNDLEVISPEWLSEMVSIALQPRVGAVGARLWYPNNTLQHGGVLLGIRGVAGHAHYRLDRHHHGYIGRAALISSFSAVTAACMVIRKAVYDEVGGLNENDLQVSFNDIDFCLRVRGAGYRNVWTPYAELYHLESATRGYEYTPEKQVRFAKEIQYMKQRWGDTLLNDPGYSPNLTLDGADFTLAWPPRINQV